jgi:hypothetical protein
MSPLSLQRQHVSSFQSADMSAHSKDDLWSASESLTRLTLSGPFVKTQLYDAIDQARDHVVDFRRGGAGKRHAYGSDSVRTAARTE